MKIKPILITVLVIFFLPFASFSAEAKPSVISFTSSGGTQDGGTITYGEGVYTWTVNLPSNFTKVETSHYDKNDPGVGKKYMGWNGYLQANDQIVWQFRSWSAETGGIIYDASLDEEVKEASGSGLWIDATKFFKAGSNTVSFRHFNEGDGIGFKIRVTAAPAVPVQEAQEVENVETPSQSDESVESVESVEKGADLYLEASENLANGNFSGAKAKFEEAAQYFLGASKSSREKESEPT